MRPRYICVEAEGRCSVPGQVPLARAAKADHVSCPVIAFLSQVLIVPQEHVMAMTDADEAAEPVPGEIHLFSVSRLRGPCA